MKIWLLAGGIILVAIATSGLLLLGHVARDNSLFDAWCGAASECHEIVRTVWATLPPTVPFADASPSALVSGPQWSVPISLVAIVYYAVLATVWLMIAWGQGRVARRTFLGLTIGGAVVSVFYACVMLFYLRMWCPKCATVHICNFALLFLAGSPQLAGVATAERRRALSFGPAGVATAAVAVTLVLGYFLAINVSARSAMAGTLSEYLRDGDLSVYRFQQREQLEGDVPESDSPTLGVGASEARVVATWFSDIACPHCHRVYGFLKSICGQQGNSGLTIQYRHYPLNSQCNAHVPHRHEAACRLAYLAEAARSLGGDGAFWTAYEALAEMARETDVELLAAKVAEKCQLDASEILRASRDPAIRANIAEDVAAGSALDVTVLPYVIVDKRPLDGFELENDAFWHAYLRHAATQPKLKR